MRNQWHPPSLARVGDCRGTVTDGRLPEALLTEDLDCQWDSDTVTRTSLSLGAAVRARTSPAARPPYPSLAVFPARGPEWHAGGDRHASKPVPRHHAARRLSRSLPYDSHANTVTLRVHRGSHVTVLAQW